MMLLMLMLMLVLMMLMLPQATVAKGGGQSTGAVHGESHKKTRYFFSLASPSEARSGVLHSRLVPASFLLLKPALLLNQTGRGNGDDEPGGERPVLVRGYGGGGLVPLHVRGHPRGVLRSELEKVNVRNDNMEVNAKYCDGCGEQL